MPRAALQSARMFWNSSALSGAGAWRSTKMESCKRVARVRTWRSPESAGGWPERREAR